MGGGGLRAGEFISRTGDLSPLRGRFRKGARNLRICPRVFLSRRRVTSAGGPPRVGARGSESARIEARGPMGGERRPMGSELGLLEIGRRGLEGGGGFLIDEGGEGGAFFGDF